MTGEINSRSGNMGRDLYINPELHMRYNKYCLHKEESENGKELHYIIPADGATLIDRPGNLYEISPDILTDFIKMANRVEEINDDEESALIILSFCNQYGLFNISGLYLNDYGESYFVEEYSPYEKEKFDYFWVLLSQAGIDELLHEINIDEGNSMMPLEEFASLFIPSHIKTKPNHSLGSTLKYNYYCESVYYLKQEIIKLNDKFDNWFNMTKIQSAKEYIPEVLMTNPIFISVDYDKRWKIKWIYDSLIDAINIMFITSVADQNQRLIYCEFEGCKNPFITKKDNQRYCSSGCNNADRQRRWYERNQKKNQKE